MTNYTTGRSLEYKVRFTIPGIPQHQGSRRYVGNGISVDDNKQLKPWRKDALACAAAVKGGQDGPLFTTAVRVELICYFQRPASHYGTGRNAGVLKPNAPTWHFSVPDLDKLQRALGDVLTQSQIVLDDRLIAAWDARKLYGDPRMEVAVQELLK